MTFITLLDGSQQAIPDNAYSLSFYGQMPTFQADFMTRFGAEIAAENAALKAATLAYYAQWKIFNTRNREAGLAITAKPTAPAAHVFHSFMTRENALRWWVSEDGPPVVDYACPDLDPSVVTPNGPIIGNRIGDPNSPSYKFGRMFQGGKLIGTQDVFDTTPGDTQVHGVSADGVRGVFLKWPSPFGGGYWLLLSEDII